MSKKHCRYRSLAFLIASLHSFLALSAAEIYIGDSAAEGANISAVSLIPFTIEELTVVMHTGDPIIYTAPADQELRLTEVNFVSLYEDDSADAFLTPFVAVFSNGANPNEGASYEILAIGDPITVTAVETAGAAELINGAFTVNGVNPTINVEGNEQIVAGFLEEGNIVTMTNDSSGVADYIFRGDSVTGEAIGGPLAGNNGFSLDRQLDFNIGFDVLSSSNPPVLPAEIYLGDSAAEGVDIVPINTNPETYSIPELTIVMHTGEQVIYTAPVAQELVLTQVNFVSAYEDASADAILTPFVAAFSNGANPNEGASYEILAIGDPIAVTAVETAGTAELINEAFTVSGVNPTINVSANEQIVAGFLQQGRIITLTRDSSGIADYIFNGDSLSSQSAGDPLAGNSDFQFDRQLDFNIGFDVLSGGSPSTTLDLGDIWFVGDSITQSNADGSGNSSPRNSLLRIFFDQEVSFTYTGHSTRNTDGLPATGGTPATNLYEFHSGISGSVIGNDLGTRVGMTANLESGENFWNTGRLDTVKPELILIKLGTNDIDQDFEIATAPARLSNLVDEIMDLPSVGEPTFFISTIAPTRRSEQATADVIAFNAALPDIVAAQQLAGRDIFLVDNFTPLNDNFDTLMRSDNLHPNAAGNDVMAQQWYDTIMRRFAPEPGTDFADWQFENFGSTIALSAGQGLDPDGDSIPNFSEFVFGGDPNIADGSLRGAPVLDGLTLQFRRREASSAGLIYTLQESATLQEPDWVDVTDVSVSVLSTDGAFESVEFTRPGGFIQETSRTFYRLLATEAP